MKRPFLRQGMDALLARHPFLNLGILPTVPCRRCRDLGRDHTNLCEPFLLALRVHKNPGEPLMQERKDARGSYGDFLKKNLVIPLKKLIFAPHFLYNNH